MSIKTDFIERESKPNSATLIYRNGLSYIPSGSLLEKNEHNKCPNDTNYVILRRKISQIEKLIGCCPLEQKACVLADEQRVIGCCPTNQHCVVKRRGNLNFFMGCVYNIEQDCSYGGMICPNGYGCCRSLNRANSFCAPHNGTIEKFEEYCGGKIQRYPRDIYNIEEKAANENKKIKYTYYERHKPSVIFDNFTLFGNITTEDPSLNPPQRICNGTNFRCHINHTCNIQQIIVSNITDNSTTSFLLEDFCCPENHELCYQKNSQSTIQDIGSFMGCANQMLNETCCGNSICPNDHKCCTIERFDNNLNRMLIVDKFCCPNQLQCCYDHPENILSSNPLNPYKQPLSYGYCGLRINGTDCAIDRQINDNWYLLHLHKTGNN